MRVSPFSPLVFLEKVDERAQVYDVIDLVMQIETVGLASHAFDQRHKGVHGIRGAAVEFVAGDCACRPPHRAGIRSCVGAHHFDGAGTDAAGRFVNDTLEGAVIVAVRDQAQVRQRVLDFSALEEAQTAINPIGNSGVDQPFLKNARLRVRAIQNGRIGARIALCDPVTQATDDKVGFVALVVRRVHLDGLAVCALGPQVLAHARTVIGDHGICGVQNGAGRAVVLFELDDQGAREIFLEAVNMLDARAAPAIDRLIVVADHERYACVASKQSQPGVLNGVGVLKLVDQKMLKAPPVMLQQFGVVAQHLVCAQQQLGEVDQAAALANLFV